MKTIEKTEEQIKNFIEGGKTEEAMKLIRKELNISFLLGRIYGANSVRIVFWGIGYDNDETARMVRKVTTDIIYEAKEPLEIESRLPIDQGFSSLPDLIKSLTNQNQ
jgi:hypothetical protein